jgi:hypothetical protein
MLRDADRPDLSGVMISATPGSVFGERAVSIWEVSPGAARTGPGAGVVERLRELGITVTIVAREGRRLLVPVALTIAGRLSA